MFQEENIKAVVQIIDWKFHNFIVIADTNASFFDNRNIITEQLSIINGAAVKEVQEIVMRWNIQDVDPIGILKIFK